MATKKITITLPEETLARLKEFAAAAGMPLSTYLTQVAEHHARIMDGLAALQEWAAESGPLSAEDLAWADEQIARAEAPVSSEPAEAERWAS